MLQNTCYRKVQRNSLNSNYIFNLLIEFSKTRLVIKMISVILLIVMPGNANASISMHSRAESTFTLNSGKFLLAPVTTSSSANPLIGLTLNMSKKDDYFFVKNFGTLPIAYLNMTQSLNTSTIRYCVNQLFQSGSYIKCADGSNAILVGSGTQLGRHLLMQPLVAGASYQFSALSTSSGSNLISISVSQNDLLFPNGTVFNQ